MKSYLSRLRFIQKINDWLIIAVQLLNSSGVLINGAWFFFLHRLYSYEVCLDYIQGRRMFFWSVVYLNHDVSIIIAHQSIAPRVNTRINKEVKKLQEKCKISFWLKPYIYYMVKMCEAPPPVDMKFCLSRFKFNQ